MNEFKVNKYITLKFTGGHTVIYVAGKEFIQCKYLLMNVPLKNAEDIAEIETIDDAAEVLDRSLEKQGEEIRIPREVEFWGHCSNLQVWAENNYDTRLLHSNLAFPLLKKLTKVGDIVARRVFKEEIAKRLHTGNRNVLAFLFEERYANYLTIEEIISSMLVTEDGSLVLELNASLIPDISKYEIFTFHIDRNSFNGFGIREGPSPLNEEAYNPITGKEGKKYEHRIHYIIKEKYLTGISLEGFKLLQIPEQIFKFSHLKSLVLSNNSLSSLPDSIGDLKNLKVLYISENLLQFPDVIEKLEDLMILSIINTSLISLPASIGNLKNLEVLYVVDNNLTELPASLGTLKKLKYLNIKNNKLTELPSSLGNLEKLNYLDAENNNLTELPESLRNLKKLRTLLLIGNPIKKLPLSFLNLKPHHIILDKDKVLVKKRNYLQIIENF